MPFSTQSPTRTHKPLRAMLVALSLTLLTACSTAPGKFDPEALIPKALTTCADAPAVPPRPEGPGGTLLPRTDTAKATYVVDLRDAFQDCKGTVEAVKVRRDELDKQAAKSRGLHLPKLFGK